MNSQTVVQSHSQSGAGFAIKADIGNARKMRAADCNYRVRGPHIGTEIGHVGTGADYRKKLRTVIRGAVID